MNRIFKGFIWGILLFASANAFGIEVIQVTAGDNQGLIDAIAFANISGDFEIQIIIAPDANGDMGFIFTEANEGTKNALPVITALS